MITLIFDDIVGLLFFFSCELSIHASFFKNPFIQNFGNLPFQESILPNLKKNTLVIDFELKLLILKSSFCMTCVFLRREGAFYYAKSSGQVLILSRRSLILMFAHVGKKCCS